MSLKSKDFISSLLIGTLAAGMAGCRTTPKVVQLDAAGHGTISFIGEEISDPESIQFCSGKDRKNCETYEIPRQTINSKNNSYLELRNPQEKLEIPCTVTPQLNILHLQPIYGLDSDNDLIIIAYTPEYLPQPDSIDCRIDLSGAQRGAALSSSTQETQALTKN